MGLEEGEYELTDHDVSVFSIPEDKRAEFYIALPVEKRVAVTVDWPSPGFHGE